jgi:ParB-like chromosome segregation protein Spo0J
LTDQILLVPLADIEIPEAWNARSGAWHENGSDPTTDDGGYEGLKASMAIKGVNDTPVLLRPKHGLHTRHSGPIYILVDGFRRMRVAKELNWAEIRAIVEEMTDFEARRRNIQAQTSHERLKPADLAWAVADLKRLGGPKLTDEEIGALVGISGYYTGNLRRIMQDVDPKVTAAWRASAVRVDVADLQRLTVLPAEQHWAQWETLVLDKQTRPHGSSKATAHLRLEGKVRELGKLIGDLDRLNIVTAHHARDWSGALQLVTSRQLTFEQSEKLCKILLEGYHEAFQQKETKT